MRKSRKLLSLLLCFALVFTMIPMTAFASVDTSSKLVSYQINAADNTVEVGDTFTVDVAWPDSMTVMAWTGGLRFDTDMLEVVSITEPTYSNGSKTFLTSTVEQAMENERVGFALVDLQVYTYTDITDATITFKAIKAGAPEIYLYEQYEGADGFVSDLSEEKLDLETIIINEMPAIGGTVSINEDTEGVLVYTGEEQALTANIDELTTKPGSTIAYQWYCNDVKVTGAAGQTYTLSVGDVGKTFKVEVSTDLNSGSVQSETVTYAKAAGPAVAVENVPFITGKTAATVTIGNIKAGHEYAVSTVADVDVSTLSWKTSATGAEEYTFTGLASNTPYYVYARTAETGTHEAGAPVRTADPVKTAVLITSLTVSGIAPVKNGLPVFDDTTPVGYDVMTQEWDGSQFNEDKFAANTVYSAWVILTAEDGYEFAETLVPSVEGASSVEVLDRFSDSKEITLDVTFLPTEDEAALRGNVAISGDTDQVTVDTVLSADLNNLDYNGEPADGVTYTYQWMRNGVDIVGAAGNTYTVTAADINKTIAVRVTASSNSGFVTSNGVYVPKLVAPAADTVEDSEITVTADTITITDTAVGQKYAVVKDGDADVWKDGNGGSLRFDGLAADTIYTVKTYVAETETTVAGAVSENTAKTDALIESVAAAVAAPVKYKDAADAEIADGVNYTVSTAWNPADTKFKTETAYTVTVTFTAKDGFRFSSAAAAELNGEAVNAAVINENVTLTISKTFGKTAGYDPLGGEVTISGTAKFGETLTADTSALTYGAEAFLGKELSYQWLCNGQVVGTASTYKIADAGNIGKTITLIVANAYNEGEQRAVSDTVVKADAAAAVKAEVNAVTADTIVLKNLVDGQIYGIAEGTSGAVTWNAAGDGSFENLKADTAYYIHTYRTETATHAASAEAEVLEVKTNILITQLDVNVTAAKKYEAPADAAVAEDAGYTVEDTVWSPLAESYGFAADKEYTATVTLKVKDGYNFSKALSADGVTAVYTAKYATKKQDILGGSIAFNSSKAVYNQELKVVPSLDFGAESVLNPTATYRWYIGEDVIASGLTYTPAAGDIGKTIKVVATSNQNPGEITKSITVEKADALYTTEEASVTKTTDTITVANVKAYQEYKLMKGNEVVQDWTRGTAIVFEGLDAVTEYKVITRVFETDTHKAGAEEEVSVTTEKKEHSITLTAAEVSVKVGGNTLDLTALAASDAGLAVTFAADGMPADAELKDGVITAGTTAGTFTVTVSAAGNETYKDAADKIITVEITVKDSQKFEAGFYEAVTVTYGDAAFRKEAKISEGNTAADAITYTSSNPEVASVAADGTVTIAGAGETEIKATAAANDDYAQAAVSYTLTVAPKKLAVPTAGSYTYNKAEQTLTLTGFDAETMTLSGETAKTNAGTYAASVALKDSKNYAWADGTTAAKTVNWTIAKAVPTGEPSYTKITADGKTLADANLAKGTVNAEGTIAWNNTDDTKVEANKAYGWTFTPADPDNYETLKGSITLYTKTGGGGGGGGGFPMGGGAAPAPSVQTPEFELGEGVTVKSGDDGTEAEFTVAEGYKITDVTVNGVSKGAVTKLTGLKTGDKVAVKTEKVKTEAEILQEELDKIELVTRSKIVKMKSGKPAIRINWFDKNGRKFEYDGYQIFRSTKRYSGFGTKPFFTTKKTTYYNTAIKPQITYYYKVRGYVELDGKKYYTGWSLKAWRKVSKDLF